MPVQSKAKGNNFERKIANLLSERFEEFTGIKTAFRRSVDSGSFFGKTNQQRIETHGTEHANFGDLLAPANFLFNVECKHYKSPPSLNAIIKQDWKILDEWIKQATQDGKNANKMWMIIVKFNLIDEMVVLPELVGDLSSIINYKHTVIVSLKKLLEQADSVFFS